MWHDFKKFILRGNVLDLAVAVIIGAAFQPIVSSLVDKIIMPPIGLILGKVDFSSLKYVLQEGTADGVKEVSLGYGAFIQSIVNFIIIGFCVFLIVKMAEKLHKKDAPAPIEVKMKEEVALLTEIRDLLKK